MSSPVSFSQQGNVLFLILIAVALFAALAYAVSLSMRSTSGGGASTEKSEMTASEVMNFAIAVRGAFERLRLNGCTINQINFASTAYQFIDNTTFNQANTLSPVSGRCDIFGPNGGNIPAQKIQTNIYTDTSGCGAPASNIKPGHFTFDTGAAPGVGTGSNDIVLRVGGLKNEVCERINRIALGQAIVPVSTQGYSNFTGANIDAANSSGAEDPLVQGKLEYCFKRAAPTNCTNGTGFESIYLMVLYPR